jgi:FAD/FMN-containing dehydrogenase
MAQAIGREGLQSLFGGFPKDFLTFDPEELQTYGRDWTKVYAPKPSAIAFPRTTDEVSRFLKICSQNKIAVVPSGGRTGLSGGAVAASGEVVLSLAKMNKMGPVDTLSHTVRVQAGAVTEAVHQHCAAHGLTWPVDFASKGSSQVGGNLSTNAGGVKVIHYGMSRQWVLGIQAVTMSGDILELNGALEKNNTGPDLKQLFIGSEGTLGVITEATLKLAKAPGDLCVFFFAVADMAAVLKLFHEVRRSPFNVMAFETLTHNCLEAVLAHRKMRMPLTTPNGAYVLLEVERPATPDATERLDEWLGSLFEKDLATDGTIAQSPTAARELWTLREGIAESLMAHWFVHKNDIAVPVSSLVPFVNDMMAMFKTKHSSFEVYTFGHIGDGNLHINTRKPDDMDKDAFTKLCHQADKDLFAIVKKYQGSISAEHGIGLLKKDALSFSRSQEEIALLKAIKKAFDPQGLLNPGKILDA